LLLVVAVNAALALPDRTCRADQKEGGLDKRGLPITIKVAVVGNNDKPSTFVNRQLRQSAPSNALVLLSK
jgi:hypothetical protein